MLHILSESEAEPPPPSASVAIVSVVQGADSQRNWMRLCASTWLAYAARFGFDIVVLNARPDADEAAAPSRFKWRIAEQPWAQRYERLIWLDSDILVSDAAPNILDHAGPPHKVGVCIEGGRLSAVEGQVYLEKLRNTTFSPDAFATTWPQAQGEIYVANGLPTYDYLLDAGVMVISPSRHAGVLADIYRRRQSTRAFPPALFSHALLQEDLAFVMNPRFNWGVIEPFRLYMQYGLAEETDELFIGRVVHLFLCEELRNAYFLNFRDATSLLAHLANHPAFDQPPRARAA